MRKILLTVTLLLSFSALAEGYYSSHTIQCHKVEGAGPILSYSVRLTTHENVQPLEVVDVTLIEPSNYTNVGPSDSIMHLAEPLQTPTTVTALGHNKSITIDVSSAKLTALLIDNDWHQTYSCKE